jgi:hypothetical protein
MLAPRQAINHMKTDKTAFKIIEKKYWKNGWVDEKLRITNAEDAKYLKDAGFVFPAIKKTHDEIVNDVIRMSKTATVDECLNMFSRSLSIHQVTLRSYLSSFVQAKLLPRHKFNGKGACPICGLYSKEEIDQEVMVFEKIKWGGVRLQHIEYIYVDLSLFENGICDPEGIDGLGVLLQEIETMPKPMSASKVAGSIKSFKGNKSEKEIVCGILGICNVLVDPDYPGYANVYPPDNERDLPNQHFVDLEWPYCWYNSKYGVNRSALDELRKMG